MKTDGITALCLHPFPCRGVSTACVSGGIAVRVGFRLKVERVFPFWLLFFLPVAGLIAFGRGGSRIEIIVWWIAVLIIALMIGFRDEVGGDWYHYNWQFNQVSRLSFRGALEYSDPGYYSLSWVVEDMGGDIYWLNTICGVIVMVGVGVFCRAQPLPWLGLVVAVPYLIVVVAMGYTRQSVALGCGLIGLTYLGRQNTVGFVLPVLIGATFHKSAVLLLPIAALASSRSRLWTWIWVGVTTGIGAQLLLLEQSEAMWKAYVEKGMESEGGQIRVAMNAVPAALFLILGGRLTTETGERQLWWWLATFALVCVLLVPISSTAVDRVALYFIPLQIFVFARFHRVVAEGSGRSVIAGAICVYYALVHFVWLNYASHASYWVPYKMMRF